MVLNLLTIDIILTTLKDISIFHICEKRFNIAFISCESNTRTFKIISKHIFLWFLINDEFYNKQIKQI
jgi:hypothetical protein